jgi:arylsulfatase A-like enzyme
MFRSGFQRFYAPDDGAASGGTADTASDGQAGTPAAAKNTEQPGPIPYERFKAVNDEAAELRRWRKEREKADADAKKQADEAEQKRLAEQGEFKKLAEAAEQRAKELEPHKAKAERYEASLAKLLAKEREGLPKHIIALLDKMDAADQLDYIAENREALGAKPAPPNVNATAGGGKATVDPKEREAELRRRYRI